jgi:PEP-CTERM motif
MKLQHIVAAVALAASGTAFANVLDPLAAGGLGGEMSLTVYSAQAQASVLIDTGIMLADFRSLFTTGAMTYSLDLGSNAAFNNFLALAGDASDIRFTFFGGDNSGISAAQRTMITTVSGDASAVTNGNIADSLNQIKSNYLDSANLKPAINVSLGGEANGSLLAQKGTDGNAYFLEVVGPTFGGKFVDTSAAIGTSVDVYDFVRSSTSSGIAAIATPLNSGFGVPAQATLAKNAAGAYVFSVAAPIPEPSTYALVLAGLGLAGFAARRRAAK